MRNPARSAGATAEPPPELLRELSTLLQGDLALYLSLEPRGAVFSVKSPEVVAFGKTLFVEWTKASPEARARQVLEWIESAAAYCRSPRIRWKPPEEGESPDSDPRSTSPVEFGSAGVVA